MIKDTVPAEVVSVAAKSTNKLLVKFNEGLDATSGAVLGIMLSPTVFRSAAEWSWFIGGAGYLDMTPDATYTLTAKCAGSLWKCYWKLIGDLQGAHRDLR